MDANRQGLVMYRLAQADEALQEVAVLRQAGHLRGALSRAYYGMFHAVQALAIYRQVDISKHTGAIAFFDREFVKTGVLDPQLSKWLHRMFDLRQDADYGDMFVPTPAQCDEAIVHAREFVAQVRSALPVPAAEEGTR